MNTKEAIEYIVMPNYIAPEQKTIQRRPLRTREQADVGERDPGCAGIRPLEDGEFNPIVYSGAPYTK